LEEAKPQSLLWTVPECPYRVTISATVVNEIRILAVEAFYSVPRGGVEIGGVFFGTQKRDTLHIQAHRPIPCQYATGPSFTLSVRDQVALSGLLGRAQADPDLAGMVALGWYHSHTRSEIFLSALDLQLYNEFFPETWQIALVIRPTNLQATRAGFFFRDRLGAVKSNAPIQELKLEPPDFGLTTVDSEIPSARLSSITKPLVADSIVSSPAVSEPLITSNATSNAPPPDTVLSVASLTAVPLPAPASPPAPLAVGSVATGAGIGDSSSLLVARSPDTATQPTQAEKIPVGQAVPPLQIGLPHFFAESTARPKRSAGWIWALLAIILACGAGGAAVMKWGKLGRPSDVGLGLETYDINGAFLIRWDRESELIRTAIHATLEIQDGSERTPIELSRGELAAGGYGYMRRTGQVSVRMKVDGAMPAEEYSNFNGAQSLGSQQTPTPEKVSGLAQAIAEREHLKTELINESMQSLELRRQLTDLRRQLAEAQAKSATAPK
jgi:proteasome lid subunit RPN8/RPN11